MSKPSSQKPLTIFIGEEHDDFSNVYLVHQLLESCKSKGLKVAFYPERDSQIEKMGDFTDHETGICEAKNLPENWQEIAAAVDNNPARKKEVHLVGNRGETVFDPFYVPIAGVASNGGTFPGATKAFSEVIKKIDDPEAEGFIGINPAFLPKIRDRLKELESEGLDINDPKDFGRYVDKIDNSLLLSYPLDKHMADEIKKNQGDEDVAIIFTGLNHTGTVATELGFSENEMIVIANCENDFAEHDYLSGVNVEKFAVDEKTKMPTIPSAIEERLTELQISRMIASEQKERTVEKTADLDSETRASLKEATEKPKEEKSWVERTRDKSNQKSDKSTQTKDKPTQL